MKLEIFKVLNKDIAGDKLVNMVMTTEDLKRDISELVIELLTKNYGLDIKEAECKATFNPKEQMYECGYFNLKGECLPFKRIFYRIIKATKSEIKNAEEYKKIFKR